MSNLKDTKDKAPIAWVPMDIVTAIAQVRANGFKKYGMEGIRNWISVPEEDWRHALGRHFIQYINDPDGVDKESGLPHSYHLACNLAFLISIQMRDELCVENPVSESTQNVMATPGITATQF